MNQTVTVENASVCTCEDELHCIIYGRKVAEQLYFDAASLPVDIESFWTADWEGNL